MKCSLRSEKEQCNPAFTQFTHACSGTEREPEKLVYYSFGEKNNLVGIKHRAVTEKPVEHYANREMFGSNVQVREKDAPQESCKNSDEGKI